MRVAAHADAPAVRALFARAYVDDPLLRWIFPDEPTRLEATAAWLGVYVERYLTARGGAAGRCRVTTAGGGVTGAALWRWPTDVFAGEHLPTTVGLLTALVGPAHAAAVGAAMASEAASRPAGPHAILHFLAVDAAHRGRGEARRLVDDGVARAHADGLRALLETTNPENVPVYERLGFTVHAEVRLGESGPQLWVMTR